MRTRFLDSLNNREISEYLRRSDVIVIPVGTVELHGEMPVGCEHVLPLAFAKRIAEEADALVLPGMVYFYPGATAIAQGTVSVRPSAGAAYLKEVCHSLLRQGFRRQLILTAHGPALYTVMPAVREFFEENKTPVAFLDLSARFVQLERKGPGEVDFNKLIWGAYYLLGRLAEIPMDQRPVQRAEQPAPLTQLQRDGVQFGYFFSDLTHHGWWPQKQLTPAERLARAKEGVEQIERVVRDINPRKLIEDMKSFDTWVHTEVLPKWQKQLP
jgi:creatinine amidohydrolase